jgi:hypothetical protein
LVGVVGKQFNELLDSAEVIADMYLTGRLDAGQEDGLAWIHETTIAQQCGKRMEQRETPQD